MRHGDVWAGIDRMAASRGMTASALARAAGLDATAFNPSRRVSRDGRPRWPSTESLAKALEAAGATLDDFDRHMRGARRTIPLIGSAQAGDGGYFDDAGYPAGAGWEEVPAPGLDDPTAYALKVSGDSMAPVFREGDVLIVSPAANLRPGDRVVAKTKAGEVLAKELEARTATSVRLKSLNPAAPDRRIATRDLAWIARILWASQ